MKSWNDIFRKPKNNEQKELFFSSAEWVSTFKGACQTDPPRFMDDIACDDCPLNCRDIKEIDKEDWYSQRNTHIRYAMADFYLASERLRELFSIQNEINGDL